MTPPSPFIGEGAPPSSYADLIVMGTHGRTGVFRVFMGSVAEGVMRESRCPVLTVRCGAVRE